MKPPFPPVPASWARAAALLWLPLAFALALGGCSTPIGADRVAPRTAAAQLDQSALKSRQLSSHTALVLHRYNLDKAFRQTPDAALLRLHQQATNDSRRDVLFALAELNYAHAHELRRSVKPGEPARAPDFYLAAAIYAYFYLLDTDPRLEPPPGPFDRRFRLACDFYNQGLARGVTRGTGTNAVVQFTGGERALAPGPVVVGVVRPDFKWDLGDIEKFLLADDYAVRGLTVRDRQSGLGAPLIVVGKQLEAKRFARRFPATLFLRVEGGPREWSAGGLRASLELFSTYQTSVVSAAGQTVPLESDMTAPLAWGLNDTTIWKLGAQQFFSPEEQIKSDIYFTQPYEAGRVPVVFVHGTFSSPVWWAEMWNTLRADATLRERCQFWNFVYNSGNPISLSAASLRAALLKKVEQLDPEGKDPALRRMVVIGHSQGGLLAKLTVTDTGEALWKNVTKKDFDELAVTPEVRAVLQTNFFFTRLPCVERVVFISTPHRGSYLATGLVRKLVRLFMKLPETALNAPGDLLQLHAQAALPKEIRQSVPSSLDGMAPSNPWLLALAEIPPAPGVTAHSIVAIQGDAQPPEGSDGVVKYTSAHVPYVESEYVVRSGHSCQDKPATIEEVRRILIEHVKEGR